MERKFIKREKLLFWPVLPLMLFLQRAYCIRHGKLRLDRYFLRFVFLLAVFALPLLLIPLLCALLLGMMVNVNRINILFIPRVFMAAYGLELCAEKSMNRLFHFFLLVYALFFIGFEWYYFGDYSERIALGFTLTPYGTMTLAVP